MFTIDKKVFIELVDPSLLIIIIVVVVVGGGRGGGGGGGCGRSRSKAID
jgi:hypothetical protein